MTQEEQKDAITYTAFFNTESQLWSLVGGSQLVWKKRVQTEMKAHEKRTKTRCA